jgi:hypothetical protein
VIADCKDEIREVFNDIDKNKEDYTKEAIVKARKHLVKAEMPSLKPADCRRQVRADKMALRKGKKNNRINIPIGWPPMSHDVRRESEALHE